MYLQHLGEAAHLGVAEFIKVMDANRDFYFWASTLVPEETKELKEELAKEEADMGQVFKELADLSYVLIGMFQTMPANPKHLISEEKDAEVEANITAAYIAAADAINAFRIPVALLDEAIAVVQASNMSKLDDDGNPIRRESDGKILKGPNYKAPDMSEIVAKWQQFQKDLPDMTVAANMGAADPEGSDETRY